MGVPVVETGPMTVEDFYAFTDRRPDNEKWELIDGEPVMQASTSSQHQRIVGNLLFGLGQALRASSPSWQAMPGIGLRLSSIKRPEPDVIVRPKGHPKGDPFARDCDDAVVVFEILSPSTQELDLRWKRGAYTALPALAHYVVVAQDAVEVVVFARSMGFAERRLRAGGTLELPELGISLPVSEIYSDTGLL
jgi:Uma2 family endonuclease